MATENSRIDYSIIPQNSYAAFDAMSLRNLIIERLNKQGTFTDQNYIGSNLASVIDIISYSFNTLMFYLNKTSTESMFTEAQLYENINRIVKLLDYKPVGYQTSTLPFNLFINQNSLLNPFYLIPRYSYIMVGGVPFSFNEDVTFSLNNLQIPVEDTNLIELTDISNNKLLYQGFFREAPIYNASGINNEVVTLNLNNAVVDHFNIHVYVWEKETEQWYLYKETNSLYNNFSFDRVYEKRINAEKLYEITFGDDINGRKLIEQDQVLIYFLQSFGNDGIIGPNAVDFAENRNNLTKTVLNSARFTEIFEDTRQDTSSTVMDTSMFQLLQFSNYAGSTLPKDIENADSIRKNAPSNFKSQYRLVTQEDYESFIKTNFDNFVSDVKVFSNWDYTGTYLRYFNNLKVNASTFQQIALNQTLYADACNFNNVYICGVPKIAPGSSLKYLLPSQKEYILNQIEPLKTLTSDVTFLDPIFKSVSFGFDITPYLTANTQIELQDVIDSFQLQITKEKNNNKTNQSIIADVVAVFQNYFDSTKQKLGVSFDYASLLRDVLSVNGVESIKTITSEPQMFGYAIENMNAEQTIGYNGLSFVMWNPVYPDLDQRFVAENLNINPFDFVYFNNLSTLSNKIVVV